MALSPNGFRAAALGDQHLDYVANEANAMGFTVLSYWHMDPKTWPDGSQIHDPHSFHYDYSTLGGGRTRALDINRDGRGTAYEVAMLTKYVLPLAMAHGLSVTSGLHGYVPGHSGAMTHCHVDPGTLSNLAGVPFPTPWAGKATAAATGTSPQRLEYIAWATLQKATGLVADALPGPATGTAVQKALNAHGATLSVDGVLGPQTWKAIQRALGGLTVDGIPGPLTYAALAARPEKVAK